MVSATKEKTIVYQEWEMEGWERKANTYWVQERPLWDSNFEVEPKYKYVVNWAWKQEK